MHNRIAFGAVFSGLAERGEVTQTYINFLANRAKGGASLVVSEPFAMRRTTGPVVQARVWGQTNLDMFSRLADAIAEHDSILIAQINEQGRGDLRGMRRGGAIGPSPVADDMSWTMPQALTIPEIRAMIAEMTESSARLKMCGYAGVELSAGHGHIFHQFMSPWANRREDEFGGSLLNRMRLVDELAASLRSACGPDFIIGIRLPGHDDLRTGLHWEDGAEIAAHATAMGVFDYVNFVQGSQAWTLYQHLPDMHGLRGPYIERTGWLKSFVNNVPLAVTGRILEPVQAETALAQGKADFVMLGRTLLADPGWGLKSSLGREGDIRKCVSCNNCWASTLTGQPAYCDNNPRIGKKEEVDWLPERAETTRRVVVVGGGISGLEAAWVAAARGHKVTLFSASAELGGRARLFSLLPESEAVSSIFDYQIAMAKKAGVRFELSLTATEDDIMACAPDAVILATGGSFQWPEQLPAFLGEEGFVFDFPTILRDLVGRPIRMPGTAVVYDFDGTDMTYSGAELLAGIFDKVVILTPVECVARDQAIVIKQSIYKRLLDRGIEIIPWTEPSENSRFEDGVLVYRNIMTGGETEIENVQLFTYSTPRSPRQTILAGLKAIGVEVHLVGEARAACTTIQAVREGHAIGELV